jgi:hypothetical protein
MNITFSRLGSVANGKLSPAFYNMKENIGFPFLIGKKLE